MRRGSVTDAGAWRCRSAALATCAAVFVAGCTSDDRYRVLSTVFDGVPPPGEPPRERPGRRRSAKTLPPAPAPPEMAPVVPPALAPRAPETYAEVLATFPKDVMGNVDWVAAVRDGLITPRPDSDPDVQPAPQLPFDVRLDPGIPQFEVVFPHEAHTYWLKCENCHPGIFQMRAGADPITMEKIFAGEYCGRCHGVVAFPPQTGCLRCHTKLGRASG